MTTPVIIDFIIAAILLGFTVYGTRRGMLRMLASIVIVMIALVGAGMIAASFSGPAARLVSPLIEQHIAEKVEDVLAEQTVLPELDLEDLDSLPIEKLLAELGLDADVRESMTQKVQENVQSTGTTIASAVVESMVYSIIYGVLYILSFLLLLLMLRVLLGAMNLFSKLPVIHGLNALCGGALGLLEGALVLFLTVWVLRRLGISFETAPWTQAHILKIFTTNTPLSVLSFLQ